MKRSFQRRTGLVEQRSCACGCGSLVTSKYALGHNRGRGGPCEVKNTRTLADRFWSKVSIGEGCWEWRGAKGRGYGQLSIGGVTYRSHRVAWILSIGPIPEGKSVLHHCDNPSCVRPDHLFLGTQADNVHDMEAKGRRTPARGERNGTHTHPDRLLRGTANNKAKLTENQVREIRALYDPGAVRGVGTKRWLSIRFGVCRLVIAGILDGRFWRHVA